MPSSLPQPILNSCPGCQEVLDVTLEEPYSKVECPFCAQTIRVRREFDHFIIQKQLGEGGMSRVFKAEDQALKRLVALKILNPECSQNAERIASFEREAQITANVMHPNVVRLFSVGEDQGRFYLAMELVGGGSLEDRIRARSRLSEHESLDVAIQMAQGLQSAHRSGLIHRDIKPGNLLFSEDGTAKIVDFGLALIASEQDSSAEIWATPYYVAPEKLFNKPEDARSDIFSLGATLFHALAGTPPLQADTNSIEELRLLKSKPVHLQAIAPHVSAQTCEVVQKALAFRPEDRYQTYEELLEALQAARTLLGTGGHIPWRHRQRFWLASAAALLLLGIAVFLFLRPGKKIGGGALEVGGTEQEGGAGEGSVSASFNKARDAMVAGKFREALGLFEKLQAGSTLRQPTLNWTRFNAGLCAMIVGAGEQSAAAFANIARDAHFSDEPGDQGVCLFFEKIGADMTAKKLPGADEKDKYRADTVEALGLLAIGLKHWESEQWPTADRFLSDYINARLPPDLSWVNNYHALVKPMMDDLKIVKELSGLQPSMNMTLEEGQAALEKIQEAKVRLSEGALRERINTQETRLKQRVDKMLRAKKREQLRQLDDLRKEELDELGALKMSLETFRPGWDFDSAVVAIQKKRQTFKSPEAHQVADDLTYVWFKAGQLIPQIVEDLKKFGYEGEITQKNGAPAIIGRVTQASRTAITVLTSAGEIEVPILQIAPESLVRMAQVLAEKVADSTDYYSHQEAITVFAWQVGLTELAAASAERLKRENRAFREQWLRVMELAED